MTKKIKIESIKTFITDTYKDIMLGSFKAVPVSKAVEFLAKRINETSTELHITSVKYDEFDYMYNAEVKINGSKKDIYDFLNNVHNSGIAKYFNINF